MEGSLICYLKRELPSMLLLLSLWIFDYPFPWGCFGVFNSPRIFSVSMLFAWEVSLRYLLGYTFWSEGLKMKKTLETFVSLSQRSGSREKVSGSNHHKTTTTNRWININTSRVFLFFFFSNLFLVSCFLSLCGMSGNERMMMKKLSAICCSYIIGHSRYHSSMGYPKLTTTNF